MTLNLCIIFHLNCTPYNVTGWTFGLHYQLTDSDSASRGPSATAELLVVVLVFLCLQCS